MAITAAQIMIAAGRVLNDEDATRWTFPELAAWINEGVKAIALAKPSAVAQTVTISLSAGTWQGLAADQLSLLRVTRNITAIGPPRKGGRIIRMTTHAALDASAPDWHNPDKVPYKKEVRQCVYDEDAPRSFYTYPGNDGNGIIEAVVSKLPTAIVASGDESLLASYDQDVGLPDVYLPPLTDYALYRAFSKDETEGSPGAAVRHYQAFAGAMGLKVKVAHSSNPNANAGVTSS